MIRKSHKQISHSSTYLIILGLLMLLVWVVSCKTLQQNKGYEHYPKNESWEMDSQ